MKYRHLYLWYETYLSYLKLIYVPQWKLKFRKIPAEESILSTKTHFHLFLRGYYPLKQKLSSTFEPLKKDKHTCNMST